MTLVALSVVLNALIVSPSKARGLTVCGRRRMLATWSGLVKAINAEMKSQIVAEIRINQRQLAP